jgi:hypothetical protein
MPGRRAAPLPAAAQGEPWRVAAQGGPWRAAVQDEPWRAAELVAAAAAVPVGPLVQAAPGRTRRHSPRSRRRQVEMLQSDRQAKA